ncbi:F22C12.19 [Salix koriyanagi]|uniref:F22C12.19 n=1 Tax=Salix koriyanagi TaxID=2511006 RepID=A0A9Q0Q875_9ROSI|nr:F22C12.19 [Salix koriyanagi]
MDASVEVNYPVDVVVAAEKKKKKRKNFVMGSDEVFGSDNCNSNIYSNNIRVSTVAVKEIVEVEESILVSSRVADAASIQQCSSLFAHKDETAFESTSWERVLPVEHCEQVIQRPSIPIRDISEQLHCVGSNGPSWIPRPEEVQVQRRGGKVPRSSGGYSKRPRLSPSEDSTGPDGVDNSKEPSDKLGSNPTKSDSHEKTQSAKQKNSFGSKRGERRHSKVTVKTKYDSFSMKASFSSFGSVAGGNNFFGLSGLKADVHDITKLVDDVSLNDLLNGTYDCPSLGKDKGKKAANTTESFLHSVRKACSVLQLPRPAQFLNFAETDVFSSERMPTYPSNSVSIVENGDSSATNMSSSSNKIQDSHNRPETPANLLDFSFDQPKDTLERLALPPPKDLESLLLDATKHAASSRHVPDPRPGKPTSRRASLSAFPWSHTFTGHSRTNSDSVKCLPSRSACQGRWVRTGDSFNSPGSAPCCFMNLESLAYDETLVPSQGPKLVVVGNNVDSLKPCCGWSLSTSLASTTSHVLLESEGDLKSQGKVKRCPILVEAAQTLYDIATHVVRQNQDVMSGWPKKLSQKAMKARRTRSNEKREDVSAASTSSMGYDIMLRSGVDQITPSKRPKPSTIGDKKDRGHINGLRKGAINWSTPKSSRSSPNKLIGDSIAESRHSAAYILKQACMMPPPAKALHRTYNDQQKVRK